MTKILKPGDKVQFIKDDPRVYTVYDIYGEDQVSLGIFEYPDIEQDYTVDIKELKLN